MDISLMLNLMFWFGFPALAAIFALLWILTVYRIPPIAKKLMKARSGKISMVAFTFDNTGVVDLALIPEDAIEGQIVHLKKTDDQFILPQPIAQKTMEGNPGPKLTEEELALEELMLQKCILAGGIEKPVVFIDKDTRLILPPKVLTTAQAIVEGKGEMKLEKIDVEEKPRRLVIRLDNVRQVMTRIYFTTALKELAYYNRRIGEETAGSSFGKLAISITAIIGAIIVLILLLKWLVG